MCIIFSYSFLRFLLYIPEKSVLGLLYINIYMVLMTSPRRRNWRRLPSLKAPSLSLLELPSHLKQRWCMFTALKPCLGYLLRKSHFGSRHAFKVQTSVEAEALLPALLRTEGAATGTASRFAAADRTVTLRFLYTKQLQTFCDMRCQSRKSGRTNTGAVGSTRFSLSWVYCASKSQILRDWQKHQDHENHTKVW